MRFLQTFCRNVCKLRRNALFLERNFHLEQVQDFTPTPMTVATEIYYSGYHPYTGERVFTAVRPQEKLAQRKYFFWYDRTYRIDIERSLHKLHRPDLITKLFSKNKR